MIDSLHLYFTPEGFRAELPADHVTPETEQNYQIWLTQPYKALYAYGLQPADNGSAVDCFLHHAADSFFKKLTAQPELELMRDKIKLQFTEEDYNALLRALPFALGAEYVNKAWLSRIFKGLTQVFKSEIKAYDGSVALYFEEKHQNLHVPERIFFHLVENKNDDLPFAFMATYASRGSNGKVGHYPLKYALTEYEHERTKLLELLSCLNKAAEASPLIAELMAKGELFHPLRLSGDEAFQFLKDVPAIEKTGILCRIPNWWRKQNASPQLTLELGGRKPGIISADALITLVPQLEIDGVKLTKAEIEQLLMQTEGLANLKGKWIAVNHNKLKQLLEQIDAIGGSMPLLQALRMGINSGKEEWQIEGIEIRNGEWLSELLLKLRNPKKIPTKRLPKTFNAKLRPYQKTGFQWLNYMSELGFGACLADDMGLGKTVQVLAYLDTLRQAEPSAKCLLIVPASLLSNWQKETEKFAPSLSVEIFHGRSATGISKDLKQRLPEQFAFLSITTYGMALRVEAFQEIHFRCLILDEAQAIKNPVTKQTRAIKRIPCDMRIAMTGTPIENDLGNLWSLFDFLNKGLLGTAGEFKDFSASLSRHPEDYEKLRSMVSPFLLRRLKTDKSVIKDLPDKVEILDYSELSAKQVVLYRKVVANLAEALETADGMQRRGLVLASIMKLKQICNHPDQYLGGETYNESESGKMGLLRELCETISEKHERVLIFTQFKEIIPYLHAFLTTVFGQKGFYLHGGTPVKERGEIVEAFQGDRYVPFIILSVKAGGTGLNLTKANHVIHFDRWWNPAVENQATDRAYRIGQKSKVMVHKLVCRNTIEERIDMIINSKKELAENVIGSGGESWITEMSNEQLMNLLRLT